MADAFAARVDHTQAPSTRARAVVPSEDAALADIPKGLYVGTGGDIVMRGVGDQADTTWKNVPSGAILPFRVQYVRATGTTASNILALL